MDAKLNSTDVNKKMDDGKDDKPKLHDSQATASKSAIIPDNSIAGQTGMFTDNTMTNNELLLFGK